MRIFYLRRAVNWHNENKTRCSAIAEKPR